MSIISSIHLNRDAAVYVRQSDQVQVIHNTGSTAVQRALHGQAKALGWADGRIRIYEDAGRSAAFQQIRPQFDQLLEDIHRREIGIVLTVDPSRMSRNLEGWGKFVELVRVCRTLVYSEDHIYDVGNSEDEAMLNAAFHDLHEAYRESLQRMRGSALALARQGKLRKPLPVGYVYANGEVIKSDEVDVLDSISNIFSNYRQIKSVIALKNYYQEHKILIPSQRAKASFKLEWVEANYTRLYNFITNPAYAGIYVYGRPKNKRDAQQIQGRCTEVSRITNLECSQVFIPDAFPGYISYQEFLSNQEVLSSNSFKSGAGKARSGEALLQGIAFCGYCGLRMKSIYPTKSSPTYSCSHLYIHRNSVERKCQSIVSHVLDDIVMKIIHAVLTPGAIEIAKLRQSQEILGIQETRAQAILQLKLAQNEMERAKSLVIRALETGASSVVVQYLNQTITQAEQAIRAAQYRLKHVESSQKGKPVTHSEIPDMGSFDFSGVFKQLSEHPQLVKQVLRALIDRVLIKRMGQSVLIVVYWPTGATTVEEHPIRRKQQVRSVRRQGRNG